MTIETWLKFCAWLWSNTRCLSMIAGLLQSILQMQCNVDFLQLLNRSLQKQDYLGSISKALVFSSLLNACRIWNFWDGKIREAMFALFKQCSFKWSCPQFQITYMFNLIMVNCQHKCLNMGRNMLNTGAFLYRTFSAMPVFDSTVNSGGIVNMHVIINIYDADRPHTCLLWKYYNQAHIRLSEFHIWSSWQVLAKHLKIHRRR